MNKKIVEALILVLLLVCFFFAYFQSVELEVKAILLVNTLKALPKGAFASQVVPSLKSERPHMDPKLANLLQPDPFYDVTLPNLLPKDFAPHGILKSGTYGRPDNLHPFAGWANVSGWHSLCNVSLAKEKFGFWEQYSPDMAIKIEERMRPDGTVEFWVHLREGVFWEPLQQRWFSQKLAPWFFQSHPVTAEDFKFYFDAVNNPHVQLTGAISIRTFLSQIESIEVVDPLTLIVRYKVHEFEGKKKILYLAKQLTGSLSPLASFIFKYFPNGEKMIQDQDDPNSYRTNSTWGQNFTEHWARHIIPSCGAWSFDGFTDEKIQFKRNPNYYFSLGALMLGQEVLFKSSPDGVWQDFKTANLATFNLTPGKLIEYEDFKTSTFYQNQDSKILELPFISRSYTYIGWNMAKSLFASQKVRQALTMAIDRKRIIQSNLNGFGVEITGPFFVMSPSYDQKIVPWPFDPIFARRILAEEGWRDLDQDGVIEKQIEGVRIPFRFSLTYFVKDPTAQAIVDYVATALKEIGIECNPKGVDIADLSQEFEAKSFDSILLAWQLGSPPEDPKQLWDSKFANVPGSSNMVGFKNQEADEIILRLQFEDDRQKRLKLYHRFHAILHQEQPYTFLYTPKTVLLYRDWLQNVFLPSDRQDLIPGANVAEPSSSIFWIKPNPNF
jgi:peptide/nickel transport system substrate-binding protein